MQGLLVGFAGGAAGVGAVGLFTRVIGEHRRRLRQQAKRRQRDAEALRNWEALQERLASRTNS
jgi:hypothetical protein